MGLGQRLDFECGEMSSGHSKLRIMICLNRTDLGTVLFGFSIYFQSGADRVC